MKNAVRLPLVWFLSLSLCLNLNAVPKAPRPSPAQLGHLATELAHSQAHTREFSQAFLAETTQSGWRVETRPGSALTLDDMARGVGALYLTPPTASPLDLAFRIQLTANSATGMRMHLTAYNRAFSDVLSRRAIIFNDAQESPDTARLRVEQTFQSMAEDLSQNVRTAQIGPKTLLDHAAEFFIPTAQASSSFAPMISSLLWNAGGVACLLSVLSLLLAGSTRASSRRNYPAIFMFGFVVLGLTSAVAFHYSWQFHRSTGR